MFEQRPATLTEILSRRARQEPDRTAFTFLADGEVETARLTYAELDERARAVAALLDESGARGERVLLLFDAGLEFVTSFFGCLYAGSVAVPAPPPHPARLARTLPRVQAIAADSRPALALTSASLLSMINGAPDLRALRWLNVDEFDPEASERWQAPPQTGDDLAYLQYTSGSTSTPKGVMVTHFCLVHQSEHLARAYGYTPDSVSATWMPNFHDYGLVEGIVHPAVCGVPAYLFSPLAFVQRPARWLEIITRYGVTHSSGPNFAYELCAHKVTPEERARLDLGGWRVAGNAAEPVHRETIERFAETFASCGFRREAFSPSFGLAEATLMVTAGGPGPGPRAPLFITAQASALEQERRVVEVAPDEPGARSLVGCGQPIADTEIAIVNPETHRRCAPDELGEIWVKCAGLALGYWQRPEETEEKFHARTAGTDEGPFMRTGDLGFMRYSELFIGGRVKDLIIIRGQNYYPQDVEWTAERSHRLLRPGCCAAFAVEVGLEERLVLVLEVRREFSREDEREVLESIRERVAERHELQPYAVVLIKTGTINKTSSGKIQRHASRREFLEGTLEAVARWQAADTNLNPDFYARNAGLKRKTPAIEAVREWLTTAISRRTGIPPAEVNASQPFRYYGFDSARVVEMVGDFSAWLGRPLPPTFFWDYPTVERVARHVCEEFAPYSQAAGTRAATGSERNVLEPIAIVGMACRFPGAESIEAFWRLLRDGVDAITEVPPGRWETGLNGFARHGGFLKQVDGFDAPFFGISPREAAQIDPQQRLLLEVAWEALEDAGYAPDRLGGTRTGVFVGISNSDYALLQFNTGVSPDAYAATGSALSIAANRLSYLLDLQGPSMAIDTACSSSLVAVHAACQSIRTGESRAALAGGVNLLLTPKLTEALGRAGMMSAAGRCKTFDAEADGYVRAEGCGVIVLKRLSDALADGDRVVALIRGSAINHDGQSNGLTAPNGLAQQALVREALRQASVAAADIGYVEAHGTGTPLGDPIEFAALTAVLREGRPSAATCYVGSVKTNVGHLEAAAGIAGLIKVALSLEREHVPPHLHVRDPNPRLTTGSPLEISTRGRDWKRGSGPRLAGVSSFGFGGTNAHVVLEEAPVQPVAKPVEVDADCGGAPAQPERAAHVFCLSAQSDGALRELAHRFANHLTLRPEQPLADVCFTANVGRARFAHRLALTCETRDQLRQALHVFARGERTDGLRHAHAPTRHRRRIAFLFSGQGAQYLGMGAELYKTQPSFRRTLDRCDEILRPALERPLLSVLYSEVEPAVRLDETAYTQPALFALEYALAELWRAWGVEPDFVFGHSVGEYAAACFAGAFTLEEGLGLVADRARLMQSLPPAGEMAAVFAGAERIGPALEPYRGQVSIAAVNGPAHTVISGEREAVRAVLRRLAADGVTTRALNVSHAFHSPLMEPVLADFERALRRVPVRPLLVPLVSGLTGETLAAGTQMEASHWLANTREPVRFDAALRTLAAQGCEVFVEVGPDTPLLNMGRRCLPGADVSWLPTLRRGQNDWRVLLGSLSALYVAGVEIDWSRFDRDYTRRRLSLPTYPFERKSYWLQAQPRLQAGGEKLRAPDAAADFPQSRTNAHTPEGNSIMTIEASPLSRAAATDPHRKEAILETLRTIVGGLLQTAPETLDAHASFLEMGADSIVLAEAIRVIEDTFLVRISIRQLFEQVTTLDALAVHIAAHIEQSPAAAHNGQSKHTPALPTAGLEAPLVFAPSGPGRPLPTAPVTTFAGVPAPEPTTPTGATAGDAPPADALERLMSRQLDIIAQFSGLMSQQLSAFGRTRPTSVDAPVEAAYVEPGKQETQSPTPPTPPANGSARAHGPEGGVTRTPYVPFKPVEPGTIGGLSERQRQHLRELVERFTRRTAGSKRVAEKYRPVLADSRAIVGFRLSIKEMLYPIVGAGAEGARLRDIDGNEYVDITMGFGVHLFGHRPSFVTAAIEEQLQRGIEMGPRPALAGEVAELICELTGMERVTFTNSGTEAVMTAIRLARARTGRTKIAIFAGSYHGHSDGTLARAQGGGSALSAPLAPGIPPRVAEEVLVLEYGSPRALELLNAHANELAAVLVEPVQSRHPELQPREFLHELRAWTQAAGVVLIFDEMVTGFRVHPGGAQAWFGVAADLATYGKIAGGGLPIGIVAGRAAFMDGIDGGLWEYGDASYPRAETTYFGGTFCQHPLAMASARAVLAHLKERGPSLQAEVNERTSRLAATLNEHFAREEMPLRVAHFGSLFRFNYTGNMDLLFYHLLTKGVYVWEWRNCFLSTAHTDDDVDHIVCAVAESAAEMRAGGFIADKSGGPGNGVRPAAVKEVGVEVGRREALGFWGRREMKPALVDPPATVEEARAPATVPRTHPDKAVRFSLSFFGNYEAAFDGHKYDLLIEGAKFADRHGFEAVWMPERHFHAFGGFSPNPSVIAAALARETEHVHLRAGSVVLPLHHAVRVAEEWSVVDNLSRGRAGVSFASGWHPDDFVFAPEAYGRHRELMFEKIEEVRQLWRGEPVAVRGGAGNEIRVRLFPQPMQRELPVWITVVNNPETYRRAGEIGAGILTNLMGQTVEDLARNVALYRRALADHGHDPTRGHVALLVHTFVGAEADAVRERARRPFCDYLKSSLDLLQHLVRSQGLQIDFERLSEDDMDYILSSAYDRYVRTSALVGTPETCAPIVQHLADIGVDELACFIDFGVEAATVLESLPHLDALRERCRPQPSDPPQTYELAAEPARIPTLNVRRVPTTEAQRQLWVLAQVGDEASCAYNETLCLRISGPLNLKAFAGAIQAAVARHEALWTSLSDDGTEQLVHAPWSHELPLIDFSGAASAAEREAAAAQWLAEECRRKFDLGVAPLLRYHVLRLEAEHHLFLLSTHHVVSDGWSIGVLLDEICAAYEAGCRGVAWKPDAPLQFGDYAESLRRPEKLAKRAGDESFWLTRLGGDPPHADLPADRPRPPAQTYRGARLHTSFERQLREELRNLGRRHGATLFMTMLAGYLALVHRLTGQADVVIGIPVSGREGRTEAALVGFCTRPLPLRSRLAPGALDPTFAEFIAHVRSLLLEAYEHADYSVFSLVEKLRRPRDASRFPLFSTTFNLEPLSVPSMFGLEVEWVSAPVGHSKFDFSLNVMERDDGLRLDCDFNTDLFDSATVARTLSYFRTLLEDVARDPVRRLSELALMTEAQRRQVVAGWNNEARGAQEFRCLHEEFAEIARRMGHRTAIICGERRLSYDELDERSGRLVHRLRRLGVGPGALVGVCMERSAEMVIGMLGVLKAGGAYVPLDPSYPQERLAFMLDDAQAHVLLTQSSLTEKFNEYWGYTICLDAEEGEEEGADGVVPAVGAENLAYVIYTSGSTGQPKGVAVPHRAVHNLVRGTNYVTLEESDVVAQVSNSSFDAATFEVWGSLLSGARLVIIEKDVALAPHALAAQLEAHRVTVMFLTTALFNHMARELPAAFRGLRHLLFGGEAVEPKWVREVLEKGRPGRLLHVYGPTETTTFATWQEVTTVGEQAHLVPIGRPLTNVQIYLLDEHLRPVPVGIPGGLYIGGCGLARGYLDRPALTAERFIPDPFSSEPGARLYQTGDLARFLPDGCIEFLGRSDQQVKIRGFRVEPGEVEAVLSAHPHLAQAAVVAREDAPGDRRLVAYFVAKEGQTCGAAELRRHLAARLPAYMVPLAFVQLDALPLNANGKVDRGALPPPDEGRPELETKFVAPRSAVERRLAGFYAEVLGLQAVGVEDDFFDLGGHSLHATQVISRVRDCFNVELHLSQFFKTGTIAALASHLATV
nr:AMP-dependent synthetase and ligase [uncultured bacterium]